MEELEHLERERYGFLCMGGVFSFVGFFACGVNPFHSFFFALSFGLLAGGIYVARKSTKEYLWAHIMAEAKLNGGAPTKRGVWLGNLLPPVLVLALGVWLGGA